jgi:predicted nucleic acid-binding Zn ribbon protein
MDNLNEIVTKESSHECLECGDPLKGRSDKKFCSDACRVSYHNKKNSEKNNYMRKIDGILKKNRRVLVKLNTTGKTRLSKQKLVDAGYNFAFYTNTYITKKGSKYRFCYEHGYLELDNDYLMLVELQDYMK